MTRFTAFLAGALLLAPGIAFAQVGPPGEVINQARKALAVTPSDTVDLTLGPTRSIYIGAAAACAIAVILADDTTAVTFAAVPAGTFMPIRAKRVMSTNTVCTPILGLW